mmetsp:Transcript_13421/g.38106  ORF Transcript_13421/g.38106 Transcript_13421/m.38106 type:complete len:84 (-) Transcript_13421:858-1109(-)
MPSSKSITSKYVLYVSNVSGDTRTKDIRYEFQRTAGSVYQVERDYKTRSALVEMDRCAVTPRLACLSCGRQAQAEPVGVPPGT